MDRAGNEFFAGAGLALDQDCRIGGRDRLHLLQHMPQSRTGPNDVFEVLLRSYLVFQI